jgi:ribosomal protein L11 methylase PrmA
VPLYGYGIISSGAPVKRAAIAISTIGAVAAVVAVCLFTEAGRQWCSRSRGDRAQRPAEARERLTIRNATAEPVRYTVRPESAGAEPRRRTLAPGGIDRFSGPNAHIVTYEQAESTIETLLDPGTAYTFRYNEDKNIELYYGSHGLTDAADLAPYVATPLAVVYRILELAQLDANDVLYDLGCGDGRIVVLAAKRYGARGVGIDIVSEQIEQSRRLARSEGVERLTEFRLGDVMTADFSDATVVTLYLLPESNALLRPLFERQLADGSIVISHNYAMPGWDERETCADTVVTPDGESHYIFAYRK